MEHQKPNLPLVVGIAASAGGLPAILDLLESASCHKAMCFVIVSHIPRFRKTHLLRIMERYAHLKTREIEEGLTLETCMIYLIQPNSYVEVRGGRFRVFERPLNVPNNCADVFFKSLAADCGRNSIGVVLSGARVGADGSEGIKAIRKAGGITFAQDPATAEFSEMPELAIATGLVKQVLSPALIGHELSLISWVAGAEHVSV